MTPPTDNDGRAERIGKRCRVLMLLENESYPDDSRVVLEARSLRDAGCQVTVICPTGQSRRPYESVEGIHVYRYPKPWEAGGLVGYAWEFGYSLVMLFMVSLYVWARRGFDVVHAHAPPDMLVLIAMFYRFFGKRFVLDQHDLSPELYQAQCNGDGNRLVLAVLQWFERLACRRADYLISTNETQRTSRIERCGVAPDRCVVVRNGPAARFVEPIEPLASLRESGDIVIGYVGVMGVQDGIDYLLRALASLKEDFRRHDFRAVLVGSGPALRDLQRLAAELGLDGCAHFVGYRVGDDLLRHMAAFDICVTPDPSNPYNDGCTMVKTMEYMAMGKPVVAFDSPESQVTLGEAGLYASNNDTRELARLIVRLMDDPTERRRLGQLGRQRVVGRFMWEQQQGNLIQLYDQLLNRGATRSSVLPGGCQAPDPTRAPAARAPASGEPARNSLSHTADTVV